MTYQARVNGADCTLSISREGLRLGARFLDFADVLSLAPVNHRVYIDTIAGERVEISMLGFSFDGFWEELMQTFSARNLEALFVEDAPMMTAEGEYDMPTGQCRGSLALFSDAICILPQTESAVRIPLCFVSQLTVAGYWLRLEMQWGTVYRIGKLGYESLPFFERTAQAAERTKKDRAALLSQRKATEPFSHTGLFRTTQTTLFWEAAVSDGRCAVELHAGDDAATYLYRFAEPEPVFMNRLEEALEAMGPHREIIAMQEQQLTAKPLYRMAVRRSEAVRFLRERSAGRLIHTASHTDQLRKFLFD